ncbi:ZIP family metal transporter [Dethiobacter alkaliphilus]|uniref:ZIP family metal transporter n=1 Tax=Dethiobacter alkaliphilus TaxID=427926 RepID=UPI0022270258|nr:ZIP family metal transporter [Dethiobacter alkaliphilus]MCW3489506.1 ZIP family metal transporter [Dethiobacter alkaliphilus]
MEGLLYSFLAGTGTTVGALLLFIVGRPGKNSLSVLLGFAGGIMLGISVFELLPEAVDFGNMATAIIGFLLGCGMMYAIDRLLPHSHMSSGDVLVVENPEKIGLEKAPMLRLGYLILFGIALHNLPEGLAIGAGLEASPELGMMIAIAIGLHNVPEGLAIAGPLKAGGLPVGKVLLLTLLAGLMAPLGTAIGLLVIHISPVMVGGALAFAAGAMVYIVNDELIPQANDLNSHMANGGLIVGLLLAFALF